MGAFYYGIPCIISHGYLHSDNACIAWRFKTWHLHYKTMPRLPCLSANKEPDHKKQGGAESHVLFLLYEPRTHLCSYSKTTQWYTYRNLIRPNLIWRSRLKKNYNTNTIWYRQILVEPTGQHYEPATCTCIQGLNYISFIPFFKIKNSFVFFMIIHPTLVVHITSDIHSQNVIIQYQYYTMRYNITLLLMANYGRK